MKLSEQPEYLSAIPAAVNGDLDTARNNLSIVITRAQSEKDIHTYGYLLQVLGDIEARSGNIDLAHSYHQEAIQIDPSSALPLLLYAQGLLRAFDQPDLALSCLTNIESFLSSKQRAPSAKDLSYEWYQKEIQKLKKEADDV